MRTADARSRRAAVALALVLLVVGCAERQAPPELPRLGRIPAFSLVRESEAPFTEKQLQGKVTVANFIFTSCPTICPVIVERTRALQPKLRALGGAERAVQIVSFTVDPETDTPTELRIYAEEHGADPSLWAFVTGDTAVIARTAEAGFKVAVGPREQKPGGRYDILHASHYALVDAQGELRGFYASDDDGERALLAAAAALADQKRTKP